MTESHQPTVSALPARKSTSSKAWRRRGTLAMVMVIALVSGLACALLWWAPGPLAGSAVGLRLRDVALGLAMLGPAGLLAFAVWQGRHARALAVEASQRQAQQRRALLDALDLLPGPVALCSGRQAGIAANRALRHLCGIGDTESHPPALEWRQLVLEEDRNAWNEALTTATQTGRPQELACTMQLPAATEPVLAQMAPLGGEDAGELIVILTLLQGDAGLSQQTALQLRKLIELGEAEKWQFGQAVHDELGQRLSGMAYFAKALQRKLQQAQRGEADDAAWLTQLANESMTVARGLARGLVPVGSDDAGALAGAVAEMCDRASKTFGIACTFSADEGFDPGGAANASHLYHAIQELVTNAVKHGAARQVQVGLELLEAGQRVVVRNDGAGLAETPGRRGMGVSGVSSRVAYLGGRFTLANEDQGGVLATIDLPPPALPVAVRAADRLAGASGGAGA